MYCYFPFYVKSLEKEKDSGYFIITLNQDDENKVFSKNYWEMKDYWNDTIKEHLKTELPETVEIQESIIDNFIENLETYDLISDKKLNEFIHKGN